jgi:LysM repeat protein
LSWIGVGALSCVGGVIISALAFLLLPAPQIAGNDFESQVAGAIATASPRPAVTRCGVARDQMTAAAQGTEILQPITPVDTPTAEVETEPELPSTAREARASGAPAAEGETTHVVAQGETLWAIARANGMDAGKLAARNGLAADALLAVGDVLVIPGTAAEPQP